MNVRCAVMAVGAHGAGRLDAEDVRRVFAAAVYPLMAGETT